MIYASPTPPFLTTYYYYSTVDGGINWTSITNYNESVYNISSSGKNVLWSLYSGEIYYSTTGFPGTPVKIGELEDASLVAISGNYGLVSVYNGGVYIVNVKDATPTLDLCYSTSEPWQGIYISDTPDASGNISAIVASQNKTIYSTDITASSIVWTASNTTGIVQVAISGSTAINVPNTEGYISYSNNYGETWTSTLS